MVSLELATPANVLYFKQFLLILLLVLSFNSYQFEVQTLGAVP